MPASNPMPEAKEPLVFTDEWLAQLRAQFVGKHAYQTTYIYRVATFRKTALRRREIEAWIARLDRAEQDKLIPRLRSSENHYQTYHELAVGALLTEAGLTARYEEELDSGVSPDWIVRRSDGSLLMAVEVLSVNPSEDQADWQRAIDEIFARLDQMPAGLAVGAHVDDPDRLPDQQHIKLIETEVRRWLANGLPALGSSIAIGDVILTVLAQSPDWNGIQVAGPARAFIVDYAGLARKVSHKVHRYGGATSELHIPLVVAVIADSGTGHDAQTIDQVLFGLPKHECLFDRNSGEILGSRYVGRENALFVDKPKLSAVFSAWPGSRRWDMIVARNPGAEIPLAWTEPQPLVAADRLERKGLADVVHGR
jgi:hypothetical protein